MSYLNSKMRIEPTPTIKFKLNGVSTSNADIDKLELQACYRALSNFRTLLNRESMLDLLSDQIEDGNRYFESLIASSGGGLRECRTYLKVTGVTATDIKAITSRWLLSRPIEDMAAKYVFPAHPEHYAIMHGPGSLPRNAPDCGVEMIGEHMAKVRYVDLNKGIEDMPGWMLKKRDYDYDMAETLVAKLTSGNRFFYILNEFMDTEGGCKIRLRTFFPAAAPWSLINQHAQHLAIEFRNVLTMVDEVVQQFEDTF